MSAKLYYFEGRGLCEPIRWILSIAGVDFQDMVSPVTNFPEYTPMTEEFKSKTSQLPLIEFESDDGANKSLNQSLAICRYYANQFHLVPSDHYQAALCDEYVDAIRDFMRDFYALGYKLKPEEKLAKVKKLLLTHKPKYLDVFDSIIQSNSNPNFHLLGDTLTWADIWLTYALDQFELLYGVDLAQGCVNVQKLRETVKDTPRLKAWLGRRPSYQF